MDWSNDSPSDTCRFKELYDAFTENMTVSNKWSKTHQQQHQHTKSTLWNQNVTWVRHIRSRHSIFKQNPRKVKSYKKASWCEFKKYLAIFNYMFTPHKHEDPSHLWDRLKAAVNTLHKPTRQESVVLMSMRNVKSTSKLQCRILCISIFIVTWSVG